MTFADLQQAIIDEAKATAGKKRSAHEADFAREENRIKEEAKLAEETIISAANEEALQQARHLHQTAALTAKAKILLAKQDELDAAKQAVTKAVLAEDKDEAKELLTALLKLVPDGAGQLQAGEVHYDLVKELVDERGALKVDQQAIAGDGGFIFKGRDVELNVTVSHLVEQLFKRHRAKLAETLFG